MLGFNRDRIYQGSLEAAAFRKIFNPWTWSTNAPIRQFVEQLELQPPGVPASDAITWTVGGSNDGHVNFAFDVSPPVLVEPAPSGASTSTIAYSFDGVAGSGGTTVTRGGTFARLHHSATPTDDEGRAVQFFDLLGGADGNLNQLRIADELVSHRWATGGVPIDVRPVTLAILKDCLSVSGTTVAATPALTIPLAAFFDARNGTTIDQVVADTGDRMKNLPRRKADIEKSNLDRTDDVYVDNNAPEQGLIQQYGSATSQGTSTAVSRIRQEVFRRPIDAGVADTTVMGGFYIDREVYSPDTVQRALLRYFLEPLGVSVDKWSMGVRGRSRTYTFADVFGTYRTTLMAEIQASLTSDPYPGLASFDCSALVPAVNSSLAASVLPGANDTPRYTDVQRIFNKACIDCHGGLGYPPFSNFHDVTYLDLSENEDPVIADRLTRPHMYATMFTSSSPATSNLFQRITNTSEECPFGMMPCGGPPLAKTDIETIRRWILGSRPRTEGDPHIKTVDGTDYDFQAAGEFVLLRGENLEIQARQTAVVTEAPLPPNPHTGLSSCVSVNTAAAVRVGPHRITYQPRPNASPERGSLQLKIDDKPVDRIDETGVALSEGGRVLATTEGGVQIEYPGGTDIVITPGWWASYQIGYLNIDVRHARAVDGVMGAVAPQNWLPALPDGKLLGPQPADLHQRYVDLYETFADAWRVTDETSLFDYAPGTSSDNFSIRSWPGREPRSCAAVNEPEVLVAQPPAGKPPVRPVAAEVAQRYCHDVVEVDRRAHCEQDVMLTGEPGFAQTYLEAEKIQRNGLPTAPVLLGPPNDQENVVGNVQLTWRGTTDPEGDPLLYLQCLWAAGEMPTFHKCKRVMPSTEGTAGMRGYSRRWLALLVVAAIAALLVWRATRSVAAVGVLLLAAVALGGLGLRRTPPPRPDTMTMSATASGLRSGTAYFWKVVVQDGHGGTVESETRRFATSK